MKIIALRVSKNNIQKHTPNRIKKKKTGWGIHFK